MRRIALLLLAGTLVLMLGASGYVARVWITAPGIDELTPAYSELEPVAQRQGLRPSRKASEMRIPVPWSRIPETLRNATIAIEDERFFEHGPVDYKGIARAALRNAVSGKVLEGGSTISQQLARALYLRGRKRNLKRKLWETKLAFELEQRHSKRWILWRYLNSIPYGAVNGRTVIGVEAAAQAFFSKQASGLSLGEAALLAGLAQSPARYDPFLHPNAALGRRNQVLGKMAELGLISNAEAARVSQPAVGASICGAPREAVEPRSVDAVPVSWTNTVERTGSRDDLVAGLRSLMRRAGPSSGAYVFDATTRRPLFAAKPDTARTLASNTKLFTASAVLERFAPWGAIRTQVLGSGSAGGSHVWRGDLYLRGAGDPDFGSGSRGVDDLRVLVRQLRNRGIRRVRGKVFGDASVFDSLTGGPSSGGRTSIFVGPLAGLAFNRGNAPDPHATFVADPPAAAARALIAALERGGISVSGAAATGVAPSGSRFLAAVRSPRIEELVRRMAKWSDSFTAEMLVKRLGSRASGSGTTAAGVRAATGFARDLGVSVRLADGSGLCRLNKASPRGVVRLLDRLRHRDQFPSFFESLPVAGTDGTMHDRLRRSPARGRCRAKTATLANLSNLSGYCETEAGHTIVFSVMMDRVAVSRARRLQDKMVESIACHEATGKAERIRSGLPRPPFFRGGARKRMVALTFDDGPSRYTPKVLSILRRLHVPATFFQIGSALTSSQPIGPDERKDGFTIGSHTETHADLGRLPAAAQRREILAGASLVRQSGAALPRLFRPPYGSYNTATNYVVESLGMRTVLHSVDSRDWSEPGVRAIVRRTLAGAKPGAVVLLHDGGGDRSETVAALPAIVRGLRKRGYRLVNLPTMMREDPPAYRQPVPFSKCPRRRLAPGGTIREPSLAERVGPRPVAAVRARLLGAR